MPVRQAQARLSGQPARCRRYVCGNVPTADFPPARAVILHGFGELPLTAGDLRYHDSKLLSLSLCNFLRDLSEYSCGLTTKAIRPKDSSCPTLKE